MSGFVVIDVDGDRLEHCRTAGARVRECTQGWLVDLGDQHECVHTRGQCHALVLSRLKFARHPVIVTANGLHQAEDDGDGDHDDPRAMRELGQQHDDQDDAGEHTAEGVDCPRTHHL